MCSGVQISFVEIVGMLAAVHFFDTYMQEETEISWTASWSTLIVRWAIFESNIGYADE